MFRCHSAKSQTKAIDSSLFFSLLPANEVRPSSKLASSTCNEQIKVADNVDHSKCENTDFVTVYEFLSDERKGQTLTPQQQNVKHSS